MDGQHARAALPRVTEKGMLDARFTDEFCGGGYEDGPNVIDKCEYNYDARMHKSA
jgi:hypothetical protein